MGVIQRQGIQSALLSYSGILIGFLSLLFIQPNLLAPHEIGLTRILYSFSFLVATLLPLSVGNITTRFFPKFKNETNGNHGFFGLILIWLGAGCVLTFPILWLFHDYFIALYREQSELFSEYFLLVFPFSLIIALITLTSNYLNSCFKPVIPAFAQEVLIRVLFIALICIYAIGLIHFNQFIIGFLIIYIFQFLFILVYAKLKGEITFKPDLKKFNKPIFLQMIRYGWMVFLAGIASMAIRLTDVVILGKYSGLALTGIYAIAAFIPTFIEAPLTSLDKIANARIAYSWEKKDLNNIREIYYKSARYLFIIGGLLFLLVSLNAPHLFRLLPQAYKQGIPVVSILSLGALFNLITGSNSAIIFTSEKFSAGAIAIISVAIINLGLLFFLIPLYGLEGAAWATCISSLAYNLFKYLFILIRFRLQPFEKRTLLIAFSLLMAYGAGNLLPVVGNVFADLFLTSSVIILVYGILIWYTRTADDLKEIIPFFKKQTE